MVRGLFRHSSTLAACRPGSMGDLYVVGFGNLSGFTLEGGQLTLRLGTAGSSPSVRRHRRAKGGDRVSFAARWLLAPAPVPG
jgi:hypothetical protein